MPIPPRPSSRSREYSPAKAFCSSRKSESTLVAMRQSPGRVLGLRDGAVPGSDHETELEERSCSSVAPSLSSRPSIKSRLHPMSRLEVSRRRAARNRFLLTARDLERGDAGRQPDRASREAADNIAEEVESEVHAAIADSEHQQPCQCDDDSTPEPGIR